MFCERGEAPFPVNSVTCGNVTGRSLNGTGTVYNIKQTNEPRCEKTSLRGFRPGPTQTGLYSQRRWLEA